MSKPNNDCFELLGTICLNEINSENVATYQTFISEREKIKVTKSQTINRIINEWAEDRHLTLEVVKKK